MTEQKDTVSATHPDYDASQAARTIWCDVMQGTLKLRATNYLPQFPAEIDASYTFRKSTATFFNMTEKTRNVMTGLVFQAPIELESDVPREIKMLWENFDNQGTHGDVFWRKAFEAAFEGYTGILIDAPDTKAQSLEDEQTLQLRPYAILYHAGSVINWHYRINEVSKAKELDMVVLKEVTNEKEKEVQFVSKSVTRYRAFFMTGNRVTWELWQEKEKTPGSKEVELEKIGNGTIERLTQIPFAVIGNLGDQPPLLDIAIKNIEHFQTYSDYKGLIHKTCVPLLVAKDLVKPAEGQQLVISGDKLTEVSKDGDLAYTEVEGSSLEVIRQSLLDNREEIALMGLSLLADKTAKVDITATEALLNSIGETAELRVMARNTQDAIELSFGHIAEYQGKSRDAGGSVVMGTAWSKAEQKEEVEEEREDIRFKKEIEQPAKPAFAN